MFFPLLFLTLLSPSSSSSSPQSHFFKNSYLSVEDSSRVSLLDSGNLIISDTNGRILWKSFNSPTDTLLPSQPITKNTKLVSAGARGCLSSGYFECNFDDNNVLQLQYNGPEISSIYWANPDQNVWVNRRTIYNSSRYAVLDSGGEFLASDHFQFSAADAGQTWIARRLRPSLAQLLLTVTFFHHSHS